MNYLYKYMLSYDLNIAPTSELTNAFGIGLSENPSFVQTIEANSSGEAIEKSKNILKAFIWNTQEVPFASLTGNLEEVFDQVFTLRSIKRLV